MYMFKVQSHKQVNKVIQYVIKKSYKQKTKGQINMSVLKRYLLMF